MKRKKGLLFFLRIADLQDGVTTPLPGFSLLLNSPYSLVYIIPLRNYSYALL